MLPPKSFLYLLQISIALIPNVIAAQEESIKCTPRVASLFVPRDSLVSDDLELKKRLDNLYQQLKEPEKNSKGLHLIRNNLKGHLHKRKAEILTQWIAIAAHEKPSMDLSIEEQNAIYQQMQKISAEDVKRTAKIVHHYIGHTPNQKTLAQKAISFFTLIMPEYAIDAAYKNDLILQEADRIFKNFIQEINMQFASGSLTLNDEGGFVPFINKWKESIKETINHSQTHQKLFIRKKPKIFYQAPSIPVILQNYTIRQQSMRSEKERPSSDLFELYQAAGAFLLKDHPHAALDITTKIHPDHFIAQPQNSYTDTSTHPDIEGATFKVEERIFFHELQQVLLHDKRLNYLLRLDEREKIVRNIIGIRTALTQNLQSGKAQNSKRAFIDLNALTSSACENSAIKKNESNKLVTTSARFSNITPPNETLSLENNIDEEDNNPNIKIVLDKALSKNTYHKKSIKGKEKIEIDDDDDMDEDEQNLSSSHSKVRHILKKKKKNASRDRGSKLVSRNVENLKYTPDAQSEETLSTTNASEFFDN